MARLKSTSRAPRRKTQSTTEPRQVLGFTKTGKPIYARARRSKYGAIKTLGPAPGGGQRIYDSQLEANYAVILDARAKAHDFRGWEVQVALKIEAEGKLICRYIADFRLTMHDGSIEWHETKGKETPVWNLKHKLMNLYYFPKRPNERLEVIKKEDLPSNV